MTAEVALSVKKKPLDTDLNSGRDEARSHYSQAIFPFKRRREKAQHIRTNIEDEYAGQPSVEVEVLQPVILDVTDNIGQHSNKDITASINLDFAYLSATKGLEIDTPRTGILQSYVDIMVKDDPQWSGKVRVIIINKGREPSAFVYPEGSIFISQSLINLCDSLDEVIAVIAHEVKHLTNHTSNATYNAESRRRHKFGTSWLHEITSDAGAPELLEKVGLKSTATSDVMSILAKYYGNNRGAEHQAPELRSVQNYLVHSIRDYETSHLPPTPLPAELRTSSIPTNFELIIDATVLDDLQAVEQYLPKLHPQDLDKFFDTVNNDGYYELSEVYPEKETRIEVAKKVGTLVVQRLMADGFNSEEIKLFFLAITRWDTHLSPTFKNISELTELAPVADKMFTKSEITKENLKIFHYDGAEVNNLLRIVNINNYRFDKLADNKDNLLTDYTLVAEFIGTVSNLIKDKLPPVKNGHFVNKEGFPISEDDYEFIEIHQQLKISLFDYIKRFYLPNIPDGELDQQQIEDIFTTVKNAGFEPLNNIYYFPIEQEYIGPKNTKVIEIAFKNVYGKELVYIDLKNEIRELPSPLEFKNQIQSSSRLDIERLLNTYSIDHEIDSELKAQYVQVVLDHFDERDFSEYYLNNLIENRIGSIAMKNWRATGDPKSDSQEKFSPIANSIEIDGDETQEHDGVEQRTLTVEQLMQEYNLDHIALKAEAATQGDIARIRTQIDFVTNTIPSSELHLFEFLESIMNRGKVDPKSLDQYQLLSICNSIFRLANVSDGSISDYEQFYNLPFIQEIIIQVEKVHFKSIQDLISYLEIAIGKYGSESRYGKFSLFEDDLFSVLLANHARDELYELTLPDVLKKHDFPALLKLLQDHFPYSPQRRNLIKSIQTSYLNDPDITISDKIAFFSNEYRVLGPEGAVLIAEQIDDISTYRVFKSQLDLLAQKYISGDESLDGIAVADVVGSALTRKADLLIKTTSDKKKNSKEVSTELAIHWISTYIGDEATRSREVRFNENTGKFALSVEGRSAFSSFADMVDYFKNLSFDKRISIALKMMSDQNGLLVSEEGRNLLGKMLVEGLELSDGFFRQVLSSAIKKGDAKIVGLPAAKMIAPLLFRGLNPSAVDMKRVGNQQYVRIVGDDYANIKVKDTNYFGKIPTILSSATREIRNFGLRYHHQPESTISQLAKKSGEQYFEILANLQALVELHSEASLDSASTLPPATEAMIRAGESSPIFIRGMQMAVQLIKFEPNVANRLSQTQDSMKGMDKLRFWENLLAKTKIDSDLEDFINNKLITLDSYMGGGSLFTTYGATVKGEDGLPKKIVIKMLNPNAEEFIHLSYIFSTAVLADVEQMSDGKIKLDAKLASSLLDLSNSWCIRDINDSTYVERDEAFRSTVESLNEKAGKPVIKAPNRGFTSKKVKIEDQYPGVTLNKFLSDPDIPTQEKQVAVKKLISFFEHQFEHSSQATNGIEQFIFHSDPHAGNYMIDPHSADQVLGVIDRSMYLSLEEKDVHLFKLLYDGNSRQFAHEFVDRCLEINGVNGVDGARVKYRVLTKLIGEFVKQKFVGQINVTAFLQIILQEFANYGEKYSPTSVASEIAPSEKIIATYFRQNPESEPITAYENLKSQLLNGENGVRSLTYAEFRLLLSKMQNEGTIQKKSIEIPIDYRLMIRNIIAMRNLQQRWQD